MIIAILGGNMNFEVIERGTSIKYNKDTLYLRRDYWDDYSYRTLFDAYYCGIDENIISIGQVKIGVVGLEPNRKMNSSGYVVEPAITHDIIPKKFTQLDEKFFSLGQDESYYVKLSALEDDKRVEILTALQDIAFNSEHFSKIKYENSMRNSLLRNFSYSYVEEQLHRIAHGGARLTKYGFTYTLNPMENEESSYKLSFEVTPNSNPPSNIHVLIGRNGVGKTTLIKNMIYSIRYHNNTHGSFEYDYVGKRSNPATFSNVICVSFSPFDDFSSLDTSDSNIPCSYIGLKKQGEDLFEFIENQFMDSFKNCMMHTRKRELWSNAIEILKSDTTFSELFLEEVYSNENNFYIERMKEIFSTLSSGHKVVLLIVTCCVDKIVEKSIIFLDEPENHLHPPLLSALIRALSDLLIDRNGVAIISTHSPVVLQEVPSNCVYALRKVDQELIPERLELNTFGATIGSLTSEVFGLEVTNSGFHKLISDAVREWRDYDDILFKFDNQLGSEALLLLRTLIALNKGE